MKQPCRPSAGAKRDFLAFGEELLDLVEARRRGTNIVRRRTARERVNEALSKSCSLRRLAMEPLDEDLVYGDLDMDQSQRQEGAHLEEKESKSLSARSYQAPEAESDAPW